MNPQNGHFTPLTVPDDKQNRLLLTELFDGQYKIKPGMPVVAASAAAGVEAAR